MPDARLTRTRVATLPPGYQFGDAKFGAYGDFPYRATDPTHVRVVPESRDAHEESNNAREI